MCRFALLLASLLEGAACLGTSPPNYGWVEAERPDSANFPIDVQKSEHPELLSGGQWLFKSIEKADVPKSMPAEGLKLTYRIPVPSDGTYALWVRIGFEHARPPIEWRADDGEWHRAAPQAHTTSLMRLGFWNEVAWLSLGSVEVRGRAANLELRVKEPASDGRILLGLDAIALVAGAWVPEGRLKPGESYNALSDQVAASRVVEVPDTPLNGTRSRVSLDGPWQVARYDDPDMDRDPYAPVSTLPEPAEYPLRWMGVSIPGDAWDKPELAFGHRLLYRTRFRMPATMAGRSVSLHFSGTNWIASVFVNGTLAGTHQGVLVPWDVDISRSVRAGDVNELVIGIKGPWYAFDTKAKSQTLEEIRNTLHDSGPLGWSRWVAPIYPSTKGEGDGTAYGLVNGAALTVTGAAYVSDTFVRTSVTRHQLDATVMLKNPSAVERRVVVRTDAVLDRTGQVEAEFPPVETVVPAEGERAVEVGGPWANPRLWWPVDSPEMYTLRTAVTEDGRTLDVENQPFGFHEVTLDGIHLRLNGTIRNLWNWVEVSGDPASPEDWLKQFRAEGNRYYRFAADSMLRRWLPSREQRLDFFDRHGVPGRLSTTIDGMFITYDLHNPLVWENFRLCVKGCCNRGAYGG